MPQNSSWAKKEEMIQSEALIALTGRAYHLAIAAAQSAADLILGASSALPRVVAYERELDELRALLTAEATGDTGRPQRSHIAATVPARIGTAYARRRPFAVARVSSEWGVKPATRQWIRRSRMFQNV